MPPATRPTWRAASPLVYYYLAFLHEQQGRHGAGRRTLLPGGADARRLLLPVPGRVGRGSAGRDCPQRRPTRRRTTTWATCSTISSRRRPSSAGSSRVEHRRLVRDGAPQSGLGLLSHEERRGQGDRQLRAGGRLQRAATRGCSPSWTSSTSWATPSPRSVWPCWRRTMRPWSSGTTAQLREIMVQVLAGRYDEAIDVARQEPLPRPRRRRGDSRRLRRRPPAAGHQPAQGGQAQGRLSPISWRRPSTRRTSPSASPKNDPRAAQIAYYAGLCLRGDGRCREGQAVLHEGRGPAEPAAGRADSPRGPLLPGPVHEEAGSGRRGRTAIFDELIKTGTERLTRGEDADFFAKFGEQQTRQAQQASAHYTLGLGYLGKGDAQGGPHRVRDGREAQRQPRLGPDAGGGAAVGAGDCAVPGVTRWYHRGLPRRCRTRGTVGCS